MEDKLGLDGLKVVIKVFKPEKSTVVTIKLQGYDAINGKLLKDLTAERLPILKLSEDKKEADQDVFTTALSLELPDEVAAVKLTYYVYPNAAKGTQAIATGDLWIED